MKTKTAPPRRRRVRRGGGPRVPRYRYRRYLCSAGEWRFFEVLREAVGEEFDILMQVRVAAVLEARRGREDDFRRVSQKAFDFVLVTKGTSHVRAAVELDDRTHELPARRRRDRFLEGACKRAGLPLVRFQTARIYVVQEVAAQVEASIAGRDAWS